MNRFLHDVRHAWRVLGRQPAFSGVAILTLTLGIGATTAVFTAVYGVLLRPLPYRDPSRLVMVFYGHKGQVSPWLSPLNFRDYIPQSDAFSAAAAISPTTVNMTGSGEPERLQGVRVSWDFFNTLGVSMAHGRTFVEADALDTSDRMIVLSHGLWRRRFGGRLDVIDSTAMFDGHVVTIVGIALPDLKFPATAEFWQPLVFTSREMAPQARGAQWVQVLARLKDTVSSEQATSALHTVGARLAQEFPQTEADATPLAIPLHERIIGDSRPTLLLLFGAVTLVLLITCANVAGLLLARTQTRSQEIAVRAALGATRRQLIAQLLAESLLIGLTGAAAGVGMAYLLLCGAATRRAGIRA